MNGTPLQHFRAQSSPNVIAIPTRHDRRTGEHIVCWADIQQHFENAKSVVHGNVAVLFLTDDNFERLVPLRIAYHAGVTLEVVVADTQGSTVAISSGDIRSTSNTMDALRIAEAGSNNQALVLNPQSLVLETRVHHVSSQRHIALGSSPEGEPSSRTYTLADSNTTQQEQLHQMQQQIDKALQEIQQTKEHIYQLQRRTDDIQRTTQQKDEQSRQTTLQLQQHYDDLHQTTQRVDQHTGQRIEQVQQQMDDMLLKMQQRNQQVDQTMQLIQQRMEEQREDQQDTLSQQQTHMDVHQDLNDALLQQRQSFDRLLAIRSRAHALLSQSFQELSVPRLFIILPRATGLVGQDGKLFFSQFRLYFLCECGAHTIYKNSKEIRKVHLADHTGYNLNNHSAFFDKYGSYLLTVMYMVKYGAISSGRVVLPLSDLKLDANQDRFDFIEKDIHRLVDDMITYLEDSIRINNSDKDPTSSWELGPLELAHLTSYLETEEDENVSGNLCHTKTRDWHSVWICNQHRPKYHESRLAILQSIEEVVVANGGEYIEEQQKATIRIKSDTLTKQFFKAMEMVRWRSLNLDLSDHSTAMSIAHILVSHDIVESLVLDFGRFSLSASNSRDGIRNMELRMQKLCDLTSDDLAFMFECPHDQLTIVTTPLESDEDRLVSVLRHSAKLEVLRIGCLVNRSLAIISLITSTRETTLESGSPLPLRTFELIEELTPIDKYCFYDTPEYIISTLEFSMDYKTFNMSTNVKFSREYGPTLDFVRNYGWSVETLTVPSNFGDDHARQLLDAVRDRGSRITAFNTASKAITTAGMDILDEIFGMSPKVVSIGLWYFTLEDKRNVDKAEVSLRRYKGQLYYLRLQGSNIGDWLPRIAGIVPARDVLPKMSVFVLEGGGNGAPSKVPIDWIVAMISAPLQPSSAATLPDSLIRLKRVTLHTSLLLEDWASVIRAIDMTELEWLSFKDSNFSQKELELLVHRIADNNTSPVQLRTLCVDEKLHKQVALCATLREKVPHIEIK